MSFFLCAYTITAVNGILHRWMPVGDTIFARRSRFRSGNVWIIRSTPRRHGDHAEKPRL